MTIDPVAEYKYMYGICMGVRMDCASADMYARKYVDDLVTFAKQNKEIENAD